MNDIPKYGRRDELAAARARVEALRLKKAAEDAMPTPTRSPGGIMLGVVILILAALAAWGGSQGGWWMLLWFPVFPLFVIGLSGLIIDIPKVPRDEHGVPLKYKK